MVFFRTFGTKSSPGIVSACHFSRLYLPGVRPASRRCPRDNEASQAFSIRDGNLQNYQTVLSCELNPHPAASADPADLAVPKDQNLPEV